MASATLDLDWRLRFAAFNRLNQLRSSGGLVPAAKIDEGFEFEGQQVRFWNQPRGIWRPQILATESGAALSVFTTPPIAGRKPPYDDQVGSDRPFFLYRYQGMNPDQWDNAAVRRALELGRPLIYFYGIAKGLYDAIYPCYVMDENRAELAFFLSSDSAARPAESASPLVTVRREYATRTVKARLHQERFRELVIGAYKKRCAVCTLGHEELLDAAHILPDRDERGRPEVPNGLALCKIHHGAYDADILGISPDYRIAIRFDVLEERDGPMLQHGLQAMHERPLSVPTNSALHPNKDFLAERYEAFRTRAA